MRRPIVPTDIADTRPPRSPVRAVLRGAGFVALTLPLMPVQWTLLKVNRRLARRLPHWYHRKVCQIAGVKITVLGKVVTDRPVLLASNHVTWLDIMVLSAVAPVSFVAKKEVANWPFAGTLARLQRTVFVDRERRTSVGNTAGEIASRLRQGDAIVLFAEGTTSDGNRVLPFRSSLFGAITAGASNGDQLSLADDIVVQTLSIAYTRRNGIPMTWADRRGFGYLGDIGIGESAWSLLCGGSLEATITVGPPRPISQFADRKALAKHAETEVRAGVVAALRGTPGANGGDHV